MLPEVQIGRDRIVEMLDGGTDSAERLCRDALESGSAYRVYEEHEHPQELVANYRARVGTAARNGVPTIGGEELVQRIEGLTSLAVGMVHGPTHNIAVFFTDQYTRCVACWAIPNDWKQEERR